MRRWIRLLPLLITALWLPLQAVASVAMPFCRHAAEQAAGVEAASQEEHCAMHEGAPEPQSTNTTDPGCQSCDGCELCHLAGAGYMPATVAASEPLPAARVFAPRPQFASPSHIPEPPQYPPRRLS